MHLVESLDSDVAYYLIIGRCWLNWHMADEKEALVFALNRYELFGERAKTKVINQAPSTADLPEEQDPRRCASAFMSLG